jgi:hypothetical protein
VKTVYLISTKETYVDGSCWIPQYCMDCTGNEASKHCEEMTAFSLKNARHPFERLQYRYQMLEVKA